MEELIAKRYIKALKQSSDTKVMKDVSLVFSALAESFKDAKFINIIDNPNVSKEQKLEILLAAVKPAKSKSIDSLVKILVENNRIGIIPALAEGLRKDTAVTNKTYTGVVYSDSKITAKVVKDLSSGLSTKFDSKISLESIQNDFDGIKVDVEDLGIEINFSKTRIDSQIIEHIIKAI